FRLMGNKIYNRYSRKRGEFVMFTKTLKTQKWKKLLILALALFAVATISAVVFSSKPQTASAWWKANAIPNTWGDDSHTRNTTSTHQQLARAAYAYARPTFPNIFPAPDSGGGAVITRYADWPDNNNGSGQSEDSKYHMYYVPNPGPVNAKTRFIYHYDKAVEEYLKNNKQPSGNNLGAWGHLGAAIHYLCDLAAPVHTGDPQSAGNSGNYNSFNHMFFESDGDLMASSTTVNSLVHSSGQVLHSSNLSDLAQIVRAHHMRITMIVTLVIFSVLRLILTLLEGL
ncbi:MAG: hypothetical protein FWE92_04895, partial [Defluviitaleaceae bacterium]|nr:hypothetical protein [Defluviitaleaceae bacterium]